MAHNSPCHGPHAVWLAANAKIQAEIAATDSEDGLDDYDRLLIDDWNAQGNPNEH